MPLFQMLPLVRQWNHHPFLRIVGENVPPPQVLQITPLLIQPQRLVQAEVNEHHLLNGLVLAIRQDRVPHWMVQGCRMQRLSDPTSKRGLLLEAFC